jgi:hypothetical protein
MATRRKAKGKAKAKRKRASVTKPAIRRKTTVRKKPVKKVLARRESPTKTRPTAKAVRENLERLALERLAATAHNEEQWSFLFNTEGSVGFLYCPWSETEDWDFDGEVEGLDLRWAPDRLDPIKRGETDPNEEELRQWRQAKCRKLADGSDWCRPAWIVPLTLRKKIAGYALFLCNADEDSAPYLLGVFDSFEETKAALIVEGAVADPAGPLPAAFPSSPPVPHIQVS